MPFTVVIPARYASSRLPGKPLLELAGKPMLQHTYEVAKSSHAEHIVIATDDPRIESVAKDFGATVCMTAAGHQSGTDRLAEVVRLLDIAEETVIVNLQGDEPLMPPALLTQVAQGLSDHIDARIATLAVAITTYEEFVDPNIVKVVRDHQGLAHYFSRAPIPWDRDLAQQNRRQLSSILPPLRHLGLYAYRASYLHAYTQMPVCALEQAEQLEQLRALWAGEKIVVDIACCQPGPGVDTAEDLENAARFFANQ
ncbi:MAG: 3-deoxy-manno-octulosonate cytidylyltransferase [Gammaproteobacteria bacterium]